MKNDTGFPRGEPKPKPFEELTFHDDFMFGIVMQDRGLHARGRRMPHTVQQEDYFDFYLHTRYTEYMEVAECLKFPASMESL